MEAGGHAGEEVQKAEGGDSGGASEAVVSKAAFIGQADRICAKTSARIEKRLKPYFARGLDQLEKQSSAMIERVVAPELEAEVAAIRDLAQPAGGRAPLEASLVAIEESADEARADPTQFVVGKKPFAAAEQATKAYGFKVCGGV